MKHEPKKKPNNPVSNWMKAVDFRNNRIWRLTPDGVMRTEVDGEWITAREFDRKFPSRPPIHFYNNPENPDKTKAFMY